MDRTPGKRRVVQTLAAVAAATTAVATAGTMATANAATSSHTRNFHPGGLSAAQIAKLSANPVDRVIVLLRNQHPESDTPTASRSARAQQLHSDQAPIVNEMKQVHGQNVHGYSFINAVAGIVSKAEAARLAHNPNVLAVVPDAKQKYQAAPAEAPALGSTTLPRVAENTTPGICGTASHPLLEPQALGLMNVPAASALGATGAGVKIAVFPDGMDPNIPDFLRGGVPGHSVVFDYQDFSGDGPNAPTNGEEAFGDVSSIAAQGTQVHDLSLQVNPALGLPSPCDIRIGSVAPGASVAVMKVFSTEFAFNSGILQGMDYAVTHDHVNILSQSFGGNPVPNPGTDPIAVFDTNATRAGVTVVVSTGDAGTTNTIGSPSNAPGVIAAAASTSFRLYAQTSSYGYQVGGNKGWEDNHVSTFSSSGTTEFGPHTVDVIAPGEAGWAACSTDTTTYAGCADIYSGGTAQGIVAFGGTSQSCPFTAGVAALVIQEYRATHGGTTPSPALVKQVIMSTAGDLGVRASDQGAGMVNALRAVQLARSLPGTSTGRTGSTVLRSPNSVSWATNPGTTGYTYVAATNNGTTSRTVTPQLRGLASTATVLHAPSQVTLANTEPSNFTYMGGGTKPYITETWSEPSGYNRMVVRIAWDPTQGPIVRATIFDPSGRLASDSRPQGNNGFSEMEFPNPGAGTWKMILFSTSGLYNGQVTWGAWAQKFVNVAGAVSPTSATLAPGASKSFKVTLHSPAGAGDLAESVVLGSGIGTVPVTIRSLVPVAVGHPAGFTGMLTGGNGRPLIDGQELTYQMNVPSGVHDLNADISVAKPGYTVFAYLADPRAYPMTVGTSWDETNTASFPATLQKVHVSWANPTAGRWTLVLGLLQGGIFGAGTGGVQSMLTSTGISGTVSFNTVAASSTLPNSSSVVLTRGTGHDYTVTVKNTGNAPAAYQVDPRLNQTATYSLPDITSSPEATQIPLNGNIPQFLLPPFGSDLTMAAQVSVTSGSPVPVNFDTSPFFGYPDILSNTGTTAVAEDTQSNLPASEYACAPTEEGPFTGPQTTENFVCGASAVLNQINGEVTSSTGNAWVSNTYTPLVLQPGQTGHITVTITPNSGDGLGTKFSGFVALETFNPYVLSGDTLKLFPYSYTAG